MNHQITIEELNEFTTEQVLASEAIAGKGSKRLVMDVTLNEDGTVITVFRVTHRHSGTLTSFRTNDLKKAVQKYNSI